MEGHTCYFFTLPPSCWCSRASGADGAGRGSKGQAQWGSHPSQETRGETVKTEAANLAPLLRT